LKITCCTLSGGNYFNVKPLGDNLTISRAAGKYKHVTRTGDQLKIPIHPT